MHRFVSRISRSPIPISLVFWLLATLAMLGAGCQPALIEPLDEAQFDRSNIRFWGYAGSPGESISVEAQNSSNGWEPLVTVTSTTVPTHTGGLTGYAFEAWYYGPNIPTRFRRASPLASYGYFRTNFRIINSGGTLGALRQYHANGTNSTSTNWFEEFWHEHKVVNNATLRIDVRP